MTTSRTRSRVAVALLAAALLPMGVAMTASAETTAAPPVATPTSASSADSARAAALVADGDQDTYWESSGTSLPQWVQVDLGAPTRIDQVGMALPGSWSARTQTLAVQAGLDGIGFQTLVPTGKHTFDPATGNRVSLDFGSTLARYVRVEVTENTGARRAQLGELTVRRAESAPLSLNRVLTASGHNDVYPAANAGDGNQNTYWESANNAFPQWLQADLGSAVRADKVVLKLPTGWGARSQTLTVRASTDGTTFTDLVASRAHQFAPSSANTVTIPFTAVTTRYVRLVFTANSAWPAGQLSEFDVHGPTGGDTQAPTAPGNLAFTQPQSGQVRLTWTASTDNTGVTGYDVYANGALRTSVAGTSLAHTDSQPDGATVSYHVTARDAAGNQSAASNTVTRPGGGSSATNLAAGKPVTASSHTFTYVAANANDADLATYWEGNGQPSTLTVALGSNADISSVVLKLNPDGAWGTRTQTIQVLGREQSASGVTGIVPVATYTFAPSSGNTVTIPVTARVADVQLRFTANSGAPGGQIAEFQVLGVAAPNPDLTVSATSFSPAAPVESAAVTLSATVRNAGSAGSTATDVTFLLGTTVVSTAQVGALAAGASATVTANIGARPAGSYQYTAKVDETRKVTEQSEANNSRVHPDPLVVSPVASSDLLASPVAWAPTTPSNGQTTTFTVALRNQGGIASAGGAHGITLTVLNATTGAVVRTLTGSFTGTIAAGATTAPVTLGTWTAANGKYTVRTVVAVDANEIESRRANNTTNQSLFVGRGANMPYDTLEAEDGVLGGGAARVGPNRTVGDLAGEASGRRAVTLNTTGSSVEFTTRASTNTLVTRFSIPDAAGGGGIDATLNVYVNGTFHKAIDLTSKYAWLYGNETNPGNSPGAGGPRHIYDEANVMLNSTVPAGSRVKLQKDAANTTTYAIDFVSFEQVTAVANPDPARYAVPTGFGHQDVQNALDRARQDANLVGVYLPAGRYETSNKFQVYGKAVKVVGAGPWFTRFHSPSTQDNTDVGFRADATANGSSFTGFAYFGNYTSRIDGPGKVFDFANVANMTIDDIWAEHMICLYWGANTDQTTIKNSRIRNIFADAINMTNGSTNNHVVNNESRASGDDSFALFSAIDAGGADMRDNLYENLTSILTWRAAGIAVYGGYLNTFRNIHIADTLVYSGITVSSLDFGYPMNGFGTQPTTLSDISVIRSGGHFWGGQTFPGIWLFSASKVFQGIRISNVDIVDPTYSGIMFQTNYVGGQPQFPIRDTILTDVTITGARKSGDAYDAKSGFGLWANEMPEAGQGPAVGSVTFNNLRMSDNAQDVKNTTSTFTIVRNP